MTFTKFETKVLFKIVEAAFMDRKICLDDLPWTQPEKCAILRLCRKLHREVHKP